MSDVVAPSFFPTPVEIAGGLRWVRAHPVVATAAAAAAATAVSVFTFLQSRADDSDDEMLARMEQLQVDQQRQLSDDEDDDQDERRDTVRALRPRRSRPWADHERLPTVLDCAFVGKPLGEDVYSSTDSDASSSPTRGRNTSFGELDAEEPATLLLLPTRRPGEVEDTSASPQWGWYVSTTPPEDYYP